MPHKSPIDVQTYRRKICCVERLLLSTPSHNDIIKSNGPTLHIYKVRVKESTKFGSSHYGSKTKQMTMLVHTIGINTTIFHLDIIKSFNHKTKVSKHSKTQFDSDVFASNKSRIFDKMHNI